MFKVDDKRPDYTVAIPWYVENCFDFVEYSAYDQMLYYTLTYSYDIIWNQYVKVDGNKTSIVEHSLVRHSSSFTSNKRKEKYSKPKIDPENKPPSLEHYRSITQIQTDVLIKSLYVNIYDKKHF
jgi:hypothetical protein